MNLNRLFTACLLLLVTAGAAHAKEKEMDELMTVEYVDIERYAGKWYEIARKPNPFEKNCTGVTAEYSFRKDGKIKVENTCIKNSLDGKTKKSTGKAWVADTETNSKLKVQFFWPFSGDYWIMELGKDYEYAVVGDPGRKYYWILCREPVMDEGLYRDILERSEKQGYDLSDIIKTVQ